MKKLLFVLFTIFIGTTHSYSQEKFIDILAKLSVKEKIVKTQKVAKPNEYFELLNSKKNFKIKELGRVAWYISSYKNFSIYQLAREDVFTNDGYKEYHRQGIADYDIKFALLFDSERQRCYMIKYSAEKLYQVKPIKKYNIIRINPDWEYGINSIIRLDENFKPLFGTILMTLKIEDIYRENDEFVALFEFKQKNDTTYKKILNIPPISINEVTDTEFSKLFSDDNGYTEYIYPDWEIQDMEELFYHEGMF